MTISYDPRAAARRQLAAQRRLARHALTRQTRYSVLTIVLAAAVAGGLTGAVVALIAI